MQKEKIFLKEVHSVFQKRLYVLTPCKNHETPSITKKDIIQHLLRENILKSVGPDNLYLLLQNMYF